MSVYVAWQSATDYPAAVDRLAISAPYTKQTGSTPRQAVVYGAGDPMLVSAAGGMIVNVNAGQVVFSNGYVLTSDATVAVTLDAGGASSRTDLIVARVRDTEAGDASSYGSIEFVKGTSTTAPSVPMRSVVLAYVSVPAGASSVAGGNLTDRRVFTAAAGGVVPVAGAFATPSLVGSLADGTPVWDATAQQLGVKVGGSVRLPFDPYRPTLNEMELRSATTGSVGTSLWNWLGGMALAYSSGTGFSAASVGITCQFTGRVQVEGAWNLSGSGGGARRIIGLGPVGGGISTPSSFTPSVPPNSAGSTVTMSMVETLDVTAGDTIALWCWHDSGTNNQIGNRKLLCRRVA